MINTDELDKSTRLKNGLMYYNGLIIVCKKYCKYKDFILNANFKYIIKS